MTYFKTSTIQNNVHLYMNTEFWEQISSCVLLAQLKTLNWVVSWRVEVEDIVEHGWNLSSNSHKSGRSQEKPIGGVLSSQPHLSQTREHFLHSLCKVNLQD